ncbi:MAG: type I secretion system permease/ATPase [Pseudohongiellaceae bacterium]
MAESKNFENPLLTEFRSVRGYFLYAGLFSAALNCLMLTPILYMLLVYDRVVSSGSMETLIMLTLLLFLLLMSSGGFEWARGKLLIAANVKVEKNLRHKVSTLASRHALLTGNSIGGNQAMTDLINLRQFAVGNGVISVLDAPWALIYIAVMFMFHAYFGAAAIIAAIIMMILAIITQKSTAARMALAGSLSRTAQVSFDSNLRNTEVIHGMGMSQNIRNRDDILFDAASNEQATASVASARLQSISKSFRMLAQSLLLGLGAYLALNQEISPGMMIAGSLLLGRALAPIDMMVANWKSFVDARGQYTRLSEILRTPINVLGKVKLPDPLGALSVEQIFVIPPGSNTPCLTGVTFELEAGEALGVIGPSAAGKTSLVRSILGVWPARAGIVRLDGADINQWDRDDLGKHLGYLPQDIELFSGTIAENICRFSRTDSEKIVEAGKTAGIHKMILELPDGYDTQIGSSAGALSAGQRQRVGLARAIYDSPKLIILDEPNSNLDDQGERDLLTALRKMKASGSTIIIITHRTSILTVVDKLLLLKDGTMSRFGERDTVLKDISANTSKIAKLPNKGL